MDEKYLIFLGGGKWQNHGIKTAQDLGVKTIVIDGDPKALGFEYADIALNIDFYSRSEAVLDWLKKNKIKVSGVLSYCNEKGMELAAIISEKYKTRGMDLNQSKIMTNKGVQRNIWSSNNIPCPKWRVYKKENIDKNEIILNFSYPFIVKPTQSSGSRGVSVVKRFEHINDALSKAIKASENDEIIIENYFEGDEYTVETMTFNGDTEVFAVTKKLKVPGTNNTVANELESINFNSQTFKELSDLTKKALNALKYMDGPAHTEILFNKEFNEKVLVETAGRGGGFRVFESLVPAISGINVTKILIMQALDLSFEIPLKRKNNYGIIKFFTGKKGRIKSISGFKSLKNKNIFLEGEPFITEGDYIESLPSTDGDRLGYLLAAGPKKSYVKKIFNEAFKAIRFEYQ